MTKKFRVSFLTDNEAQVKGYEPHSTIRNTVESEIEAETPEEATIFAIDYMCEGIRNNGFRAEEDYENETVTVMDDDDNIVERYYWFKAEEEEQQ